MRTKDIFIEGLGSYIPPTVTVESAVEQGLYTTEEIELHEYGGAAIAGELPAPEMALRAAQIAVKRAGRVPTELDALFYALTWHQGPDGWLPQSYLQRHLVGDVPAFEVRQGCNGLLAALQLAVGQLRAEPDRQSALLVASDNYGTPLIDRWRIAPGVLGGDAASALVLTKRPSFAQLLSVCSQSVPEAEGLHRSGEPLFPPTVTVGRKQDFGARFEHYRANQPQEETALRTVPQHTLDLARRAVDEAGIGLEDLARVAYETHSREIVEQRCMAVLGLPMSKSTWEWGRDFGHCGASDQFLALEHLVGTGELVPGDHMLLFGTAPGIILSAAVIKVLEKPEWAL